MAPKFEGFVLSLEKFCPKKKIMVETIIVSGCGYIYIGPNE
jgi:hypothetical protein